MIEPTTLLMFAGAVLLLLMSPGPNMAFVVAHGMSHGWRGGVAAALGIGAADLVLTGLTAAGVTTVVAQWPPALDLIRGAGVCYLLWLAWKALTRPGVLQRQAATQHSLVSIGRRAMLNSLLNPKALLFFMVFLPQFVEAEGGVAQQLMVLGAVLTTISVAFHATLGALGGIVNRLATGDRRANRWPSRLLAAVLTLLAIRLALTTTAAA
jgi:threonine/homoserine/homoserine lactone efflux protein